MITDREWKAIQKRWYYAPQFEFRVDADRLRLSLTMLKGGKMAYQVYVNGWLPVKQLRQQDAPERRYYPVKEAYYFSAVERRDHALRRALKLKLTGKTATLLPYWRSFKQFKKQMQRLAQSSEVALIEP